MATQASAVRYGTPIRTSPIPGINAMAAYLPQLYSLRESERQNEAALAESKRQFGLSYNLAQEQQAAAEEAARRSGQLGLGNLGLSIGMGVQKYTDTSNVSKALTDALTSEGGTDATKTLTDTLTGATTAAAATPISEGWSTLSNWTSPLSTASPWYGLAAGATLGEKVGQVIPIGGGSTKSILGGALAGGVTGYLTSGGDIYSTIVSSLLGGVGGGW